MYSYKHKGCRGQMPRKRSSIASWRAGDDSRSARGSLVTAGFHYSTPSRNSEKMMNTVRVSNRGLYRWTRSIWLTNNSPDRNVDAAHWASARSTGPGSTYRTHPTHGFSLIYKQTLLTVPLPSSTHFMVLLDVSIFP
ncbi:hypothetical protein J6590_012894 [Homalodisca vitripennis]|nr:hypothetical protein J6590_013158 [Homalodisca vitripennis]KAG8322901.1 hypothetical protein J6590_012894 [Homalodisca vitripennis]